MFHAVLFHSISSNTFGLLRQIVSGFYDLSTEINGAKEHRYYGHFIALLRLSWQSLRSASDLALVRNGEKHNRHRYSPQSVRYRPCAAVRERMSTIGGFERWQG